VLPAEVFLSHSHKDKAVTKKLADELRRHGIAAWYSERNIAGAQQWLDEIGAALERCDWFIIVLTPDAVKSKWVKREVTAALTDDRYNERIIPLLVKTCEIKQLAWPLATLQMVSLKVFKNGLRELLRIWGIGYRP
jgi:hypothetical protein